MPSRLAQTSRKRPPVTRSKTQKAALATETLVRQRGTVSDPSPSKIVSAGRDASPAPTVSPSISSNETEEVDVQSITQKQSLEITKIILHSAVRIHLYSKLCIDKF